MSNGIPKTGSIAEYIGRTVDLAGYHGVAPTGDNRLSEVLAPPGTGGAVVTGVQKVAQRFLVELLKEIGSMKFRPDEGSVFLTEAREGRLQTQSDVISAFARGVESVRATIQADELDSDPDDERFVTATVSQVVVTPGAAVVRFTVETQAGEDRNYIFPLTIPLN